MRIRKAEREDAAAIGIVHVRAWRAAFQGVVVQELLDEMEFGRSAAEWDSLLAEARWPESGAMVAEDDGRRVVAFVGFGPGEAPGVAEIATCYSVPEVWGTGVGRRLFSAAMSALADAGYEQVTLWVLEANRRARRFYEAAGWRADGGSEPVPNGAAPLLKLRYRWVPPPR